MSVKYMSLFLTLAVLLMESQLGYGQSSTQTLFGQYLRLATDFKKSVRNGTRKISWSGDFKEEEKNDLTDFFDNDQHEYGLAGSVTKVDLDHDGQAEFVAKNLMILDPKPFYFGHSLGVVKRTAQGFEVIVVSGPNFDTASIQRKLQVIDFDGDDLKDLIYQRMFESYGADPSYSAIIYKNVGSHFKRVYARRIDDYLRFEDIDRDGRLELVETINELGLEEVGLKNYWTNLYFWSGSSFRTDPRRYVDFYRKKAEQYAANIRNTRLQIDERKEIFPGRDSYSEYLEQHVIKANETYQRRIEKQIGATEKR